MEFSLLEKAAYKEPKRKGGRKLTFPTLDVSELGACVSSAKPKQKDQLRHIHPPPHPRNSVWDKSLPISSDRAPSFSSLPPSRKLALLPSFSSRPLSQSLEDPKLTSRPSSLTNVLRSKLPIQSALKGCDLLCCLVGGSSTLRVLLTLSLSSSVDVEGIRPVSIPSCSERS